VSDIHNPHPLGGVGLEWRDALTNAIDKDLTATPRQAPETGRHEVSKDRLDRFIKKL
jgi:hypothetical protein